MSKEVEFGDQKITIESAEITQADVPVCENPDCLEWLPASLYFEAFSPSIKKGQKVRFRSNDVSPWVYGTAERDGYIRVAITQTPA